MVQRTIFDTVPDKKREKINFTVIQDMGEEPGQEIELFQADEHPGTKKKRGKVSIAHAVKKALLPIALIMTSVFLGAQVQASTHGQIIYSPQNEAIISNIIETSTDCATRATASVEEKRGDLSFHIGIPKEDSSLEKASHRSKAAEAHIITTNAKIKSDIPAAEESADANDNINTSYGRIIKGTEEEAKPTEKGAPMHETANAKTDPPDPKSRDKNSIYNTYWRDKVSISSKLYFNSLPENQLEDLSRQRLSKVMGENVLGRAPRTPRVSLWVSFRLIVDLNIIRMVKPSAMQTLRSNDPSSSWLEVP